MRIFLWTICFCFLSVASAFVSPNVLYHQRTDSSISKTASVKHPTFPLPLTSLSILVKTRCCSTMLCAGGNNDNDDDILAALGEADNENIRIIRGTGDEITDDLWDDIQGSAPSQFEVMKQLLGINIFTYILAAAIVVMLSLNAFLGPGWLGQMIGIEGTGTFTEISDSLPSNIDLNQPENLL
mmetsp:Transcript_31661/g.46406  ORF Transcript_31661/g.46406 Transcript_31661/m.46406 type:complete len:183 (-) Transcript_31661:970-1518(-)